MSVDLVQGQHKSINFFFLDCKNEFKWAYPKHVTKHKKRFDLKHSLRQNEAVKGHITESIKRKR